MKSGNTKISYSYSRIFIFTLFIIFIASFFACNSDYQPKPKGYFRINLPKKVYVKFDESYPFTFEYPIYAKVLPDTDKGAEPYWMNIMFPKFKGQIHVSFKFIKNNLNKYLEDSRTLAMKHISKANSINEQVINNKKDRVYGLAYEISGTGAASSYQFYLTDSTTSFLRGALYFNIVPNNDSLAPVIDFIKQDMVHMMKTLKWKQIKQ